MVLCVSKYDLDNGNSKFNNEELQKFVEENHFIAGFFTSAKTGLNSDASLDVLVKNVDKQSSVQPPKIEDSISSGASKLIKYKSPKKKGCC